MPRIVALVATEDGVLLRKVVRATRRAAPTWPKRGSWFSSSTVSGRSPSMSFSITAS